MNNHDIKVFFLFADLHQTLTAMNAKATYFIRQILILATSVLTLTGAAAYAQTKSVMFNALTVHDGLPQMSVFAVTQDKDGYMWFATRDGLSRYDGYRFKNYKTEKDNSRSISDNEVTAVRCTSDGKLWVGTNRGLNLYVPETDSFIRFLPPDEFPGETVYKFCEDSYGKLWCSTNGGVVRIDCESARIEKSVKFDIGQIKYIACTIDPDVLVMASTLDVYRYSISRDTLEHIDCVPSDLNIQAVFRDSRANIWIGTGTEGVIVLSADLQLLERLQAEEGGLNNNFVRCFCEDKKGRIIIGSYDGVNIYSPADRGMLSYKIGQNTNVNSLSFFSVLSAYCDRDNTIWLTSYIGGVNYFNLEDDNFLYYEEPVVDGKLTIGIISSIVHKNGWIWVGKEGGGLLRCSDATGEWERVPLPSDDSRDFRSSIVNSIGEHGDDIWVGLNNGRLHRLDTRTGKVTKTYRISMDQPVVDTHIDNEGNVYIGTYLRNRGSDLLVIGRDGRMRGSFIDAGTGEPASFKFVNSTIDGRDGSVIMGCSNGGVYSYNIHSGRYRYSSLLQGEDNPVRINQLFRDSEGMVWAATRYHGLLELNEELEVTGRITSRDGLPSDNVRSVTEGHDGKLWVTTACCVSSIDRTNGKIRSWNSPQVNEFSLKSCLVLDDRIIFGADKGLVTLNPAKEGRVYSAKKPVIEVLRNDSDALELSFSSLDYVAKGLIRFEYRLDGYDREWTSDIPTRANAVYRKLRPGRYVFRVRAYKGVEEDMGSEEASLTIRIPRPWWQSWWFALCCILVVLGVIFLIHKLRKAAETLEDERDRMQKICADMFAEQTSSGKQKDSPEQDFMQRFYKLLREKLADQNLTIDYMCSELGTSKTGLYNKVKKHTGLAPVDFIRKSRLQASAQLLKEGKHSISEISSIVGFCSPSYYGSCFKKEYGMTPREYAETINNNTE